MKRLILDYLWRKRWILGLGALAQFGFGWGELAFGEGGKPQSAIQFQIGIFMGVFFLSLDLQKGFARVITTLPLSGRQIGRALWLATVGLPAASLTLLLIAGAGAHRLFHPEADIPWSTLGSTALGTLLWMGIAFSLLVNLSFSPQGDWRQRWLAILGGALWGLMMSGGFLLGRDLPSSPTKFLVLVVVGLTLTVVGWFRAGKSLAGQAATRRLATSTDSADMADTAVAAHRPGGRGGLPFLLGHTFSRAFLIGIAMIALMPVLVFFRGRVHSWRDVFTSLSGAGFYPFWFIVFVTLAPVLLQLRFLRTLPVSPLRLSAVLLAMILLPLLALGGLSAGAAYLAAGPVEALAVGRGYLITLGPAAVSIALVVWVGTARLAYMLLVALMMGGQFLLVDLRVAGPHAPGAPTSLLLVAIALVIAAAFALTRLALVRRSVAYQVNAGSPFGRGWFPRR